jgi:hypothetical protein
MFNLYEFWEQTVSDEALAAMDDGFTVDDPDASGPFLWTEEWNPSVDPYVTTHIEPDGTKTPNLGDELSVYTMIEAWDVLDEIAEWCTDQLPARDHAEDMRRVELEKLIVTPLPRKKPDTREIVENSLEKVTF